MTDGELADSRRDQLQSRIEVEAEQQCPPCTRTIWASFYFDGFGFTDKSGPQTNIVKLYRAGYNLEEKGMHTFYYPGLGADFDPETAALAKAVAGIAGNKVKDEATGAAKDKAKESGMGLIEVAGESWKKSRARGGSILQSASQALDSAWDAGSKQVRKTRYAVKNAVRDPEKLLEKKIRRLRREWQDFSRAVARHPFRSLAGGAAKQVGKQILVYTGGAAAESAGVIRDSKLAAALFNTGVDTRLESAKKDFLGAVALAKSKAPLDHINVALFGYDMGGGLALAFCKELLEDICEGSGRVDGVPVHIRFMGLFDCVTNRYEDNFLTGFMPLSNQVSSELIVPDAVERCVHYAAAHELRFYKPLTIIGADPEDFRGRRQEQLFPGAQEDVGGGGEPDEHGVSDQLARYPLQMMYNRAYGAGIPMPSLSELKDIDPKLVVEIQFSQEIANFQRQYREAVRSQVVVTKTITSGLIGLQKSPHIRSLQEISQESALSATLRCMAPPQPSQYTELPKDVEEQYKGHIVIYIQWLRMWYDQNATRAQERTGVLGLGTAVDAAAADRYEKLADELAYLERNARAYAGFDMDHAKNQIDGKVASNIFVTDPQGQALYWIWLNADKKSEKVAELYPGFIAFAHDSMAECGLENLYGDFVMSRHYFNRRPMQKLATKPDPTFLKNLEKIYKKIVG